MLYKVSIFFDVSLMNSRLLEWIERCGTGFKLGYYIVMSSGQGWLNLDSWEKHHLYCHSASLHLRCINGDGDGVIIAVIIIHVIIVIVVVIIIIVIVKPWLHPRCCFITDSIA